MVANKHRPVVSSHQLLLIFAVMQQSIFRKENICMHCYHSPLDIALITPPDAAFRPLSVRIAKGSLHFSTCIKRVPYFPCAHQQANVHLRTHHTPIWDYLNYSARYHYNLHSAIKIGYMRDGLLSKYTP